MSADSVDIELAFRQTSNDTFGVDATIQTPDGNTVACEARDVPVTLDLADLRARTLDPTDYGQALTHMLFGPAQLREAWIKATTYADATNALLRVRLRIAPDAGVLHALRWETLCNPKTLDPLCFSQHILLSRYLDASDLGRGPSLTRSQLRAVALIASPHDIKDFSLTPIAVADEVRRTQAALGEIDLTVLARDHGQAPASLTALSDALKRGAAILYLVCHGALINDEPTLYLEDAKGRCVPVAGGALVRAITNLPASKRPLLVVLAACRSAGNGAEDVTSALAPRLAQAGVAAVIGMQGDVPIPTIERLMPRLFESLAEDGVIDRALALARVGLDEGDDWWMPALYLRSRDGRLWIDSLPMPMIAVTSPPPSTGLAILTSQLRDPRVRDELAEFRAIFSAARNQISLLNHYKELHDTLQELERPFIVIVRDRRRLIDDPTVWVDFDLQIAQLHDFSRTALELMADSRLVDESAWGIQQLQLASADLDLAQTQADPHRLGLAIGRYKRVLTCELPRADRRLAACAGDLRLAQVAQALNVVQAALTGDRSDLSARRELERWVTTLDSLRSRLEGLVPKHHHWQAVDNELRRVAESLNGDPVDLELAWGDLLLQTTPLFGSVTEEWATSLNALGAQISQALTAGALPQARHHFISYQSRTTSRFVKVDKALLATCNELRHAGDALDLILRMLDEGV